MADTTTKTAAAKTTAAAKKPAATKAKSPVAEKNVAEASAAPKAPKASAPVKIKSAAPAKKAELTSGLRVTQIHSGAGRSQAQNGTLRGLGLAKIGRSKVLQDTPAVRGMINAVQHLVKVEVVG